MTMNCTKKGFKLDHLERQSRGDRDTNQPSNSQKTKDIIHLTWRITQKILTTLKKAQMVKNSMEKFVKAF